MLSFSYTENNSATGHIYIVERSSDLKTCCHLTYPTYLLTDFNEDPYRSDYLSSCFRRFWILAFALSSCFMISQRTKLVLLLAC